MDGPLIERARWSRADLELLPDDGRIYEIINGDLCISGPPHWHHQKTCGNMYAALERWSAETGLGEPSIAPGVLFGETDNVVPDVVWVSKERLAVLMNEAGHLTAAPDLVVEVLSPGVQNERRDQEAKRKLYEVQGVQEYWIADWRLRQIAVYRRERGVLRLVSTLLATDELTSPLLLGFVYPVSSLLSSETPGRRPHD